MKCTLCNSDFSCGKKASCWCFSFPKIKPIKGISNCLCSECLISAVSDQVNKGIVDLDPENLKKISGLGISESLKEGIDFIIDENDNYVFTRWYLLRRFYCCENSCKNCPY